MDKMVNKNKRIGYTLMELVLVMLLISIISTGVVISYDRIVNRSRDAGVDVNLKSINTSIDYLKERNGYIPNIAELQQELGMESYKFELDRALISDIDGELFVTIRATTTELSKHNIPYSINIVALYNGSCGLYTDGDFIDVSTYERELMDYDINKIKMIILDNTPSGVPEIYWFN